MINKEEEQGRLISVETNIVADRTVREVERIFSSIQDERHRQGSARAWSSVVKNMGLPIDVASAATIAWKMIGHFRYTSAGERLTIRQLEEICHDARRRFIEQHVINYAAYRVIVDFHDWLIDKNLIPRFSKAEGYWRKLKRAFDEYEAANTGNLEMSVRSTFHDYMRLSYDNISDALERMEMAVRDYLIQHRAKMVDAGQKDDVAMLQKVIPCMALLQSMTHSYRDFFADIITTHGGDFSMAFRYADLTKMQQNFINLCEVQGLMFCKDKHGQPDLMGVDIGSSARVKGIWNNILATLKNSKLADNTAERAINLNPKAQQEYRAIFEEQENLRRQAEEEKKQREMEEGFKALEEKYKVTKL